MFYRIQRFTPYAFTSNTEEKENHYKDHMTSIIDSIWQPGHEEGWQKTILSALKPMVIGGKIYIQVKVWIFLRVVKFGASGKLDFDIPSTTEMSYTLKHIYIIVQSYLII